MLHIGSFAGNLAAQGPIQGMRNIGMQFINGITILLLYQLVGEITVLLLRIPVPGPVLGMLLLFTTLLVRRGTPTSLDLASTTPAPPERFRSALKWAHFQALRWP